MHIVDRRIRLLAVALLLTAAGCEKAQDFAYRQAAQRVAEADRTDWLSDGALHLVLCGTGTPLADPDRAGPCAAVIANGSLFLFDTGPGSWETVQLGRLPRAKLRAVMLTHFHSDHIGDLGETVLQSWVAGRTRPLDIYGPPGVAQVVDGFRAAYALDAQYRVAHHGEGAMPTAAAGAVAHAVDLPAADGEQVFFDEDGVRIVAFAVDHAPVAPAYGYRIEYGGRSLVISGDTKESSNLAAHARGADIILHEALAAHMVDRISKELSALGATRLAKLTADIQDYHTTPVQAAKLAAEAQARMLVLTHMVPAPANRMLKRLFSQGIDDAWSGAVVLGADGMHFRLPARSEEIEQTTI